MSNELEPSIYTDDEYGQKIFKSKRDPTMHGGLSNASATPDNRLDMQGVSEARSEVVIEKVSKQIMEHIHGKHGPSASLPVLVNLLNTEIEMLKTLKDVRLLLDAKIPIGQMRAFTLNYNIDSMNGAVTPGFTHIEFTDSQFTFGVPVNQVINEPQRKLYKLKIMNDGPASIQFSANFPKADRSAEITLNSGEMDESLDFLYPVIWSLNIAIIPNSSDRTKSQTKVRVFYVY